MPSFNQVKEIRSAMGQGAIVKNPGGRLHDELALIRSELGMAPWSGEGIDHRRNQKQIRERLGMKVVDTNPDSVVMTPGPG